MLFAIDNWNNIVLKYSISFSTLSICFFTSISAFCAFFALLKIAFKLDDGSSRGLSLISIGELSLK